MAKQVIKMTDTALRKIAPPANGEPRKEVWDAEERGMYQRISASGDRKWYVLGRVRRTGSPRYNEPLGPYPAYSIADAREMAREVKRHAERGVHPREVKEAEAAAQAAEREAEEAVYKKTFANLRKQFIAEGKKRGMRTSASKPWAPTTLANNQWAIDKCAELDDMVVTDITRGMIQDLIDDVEETVGENDNDHQQGAAAAHKVHEILKTFFTWCLRKDHVELSPCQGITVPAKVKRDRTLKDAELRAIWNALGEHGEPIADAFKVLILTGQRRSEIAKADLDEIDFERRLLSLDGSRTKNGLPHAVPLSPAVIDIIRAQQRNGGYIFTTTGKTPVSGFGKVKKRIAEMSDTEVPHWQPHDFRRTMITGMNRIGILPHVVEAAVNHVSGPAKRGVAGVYNYATYLPERRHALNAWTVYVAGAILGPKAWKKKVAEIVADDEETSAQVAKLLDEDPDWRVKVNTILAQKDAWVVKASSILTGAEPDEQADNVTNLDDHRVPA